MNWKVEKGMSSTMLCTWQMFLNLITFSSPRNAYYHHFSDEEVGAEVTC